jgi:cell division protein FtsW
LARKLKIDRVLFTATLLLICVSVVMVYSASAVVALERFQQPYLFLTKQALWSVLGLAVLVVAMRVDYRTYRNEAFIWCLLGVVFVMLVAVLFSAPVNGTRRWFGIGGLGVQPSELAKIACVFFTALMLERRMHRIDDLSYSLMPIGLIIGWSLRSSSCSPTSARRSRSRSWWLSWSLPPACTIATSSPRTCRTPRDLSGARRRAVSAPPPPRVLGPLGGSARRRVSDHSVPGGCGHRRRIRPRPDGRVQKLFYLPEPHTDFIYAVIGEELGLVGATAILLCFCVIAWRGLRIAARAEDTFGSFVALGLTTMIAAQAFVNISVVLGLMPTKGIPLPLVSFGGSSLLINLLGMGVLLNISQHETVEA